MNTLVYKQGTASEDVQCLYRFVTDKRLFARVILTVKSINFKVRFTLKVSSQVQLDFLINLTKLILNRIILTTQDLALTV